jgi:hypothetical protein
MTVPLKNGNKLLPYDLNNGPDCPAMDVDLGGVNAGEEDVGQDHHAESLVDLPQVHLTRLGQRGTRIERRLPAVFVLFRPRKSENIKSSLWLRIGYDTVPDPVF